MIKALSRVASTAATSSMRGGKRPEGGGAELGTVGGKEAWGRDFAGILAGCRNVELDCWSVELGCWSVELAGVGFG